MIPAYEYADKLGLSYCNMIDFLKNKGYFEFINNNKTEL